jgi:UDP-hydrolysing UDP-N-acetyl-D-glucosamine 2-epimerase
MKRKICVFIGSRANHGRLKSVCKTIQEHDALELQLILGASFYNAEVDFPVASRIQCLINSDDHEAMALTTGVLLTKVSMELARLKPDVVLVHGDRYEVLAVAQAAAYMNIPLAHTEGGEITGCIDDKVRNAITALADIHFPVTALSGERIGYETLNQTKDIFVVGSTALDSIKHIRVKNIKRDGIVFLYHPETTCEEDIVPLIDVLNQVIDELKCKVTWINPNIDAGNKQIIQKLHQTGWELKKNLSPEEYAELLKGASVCVGNSSSFIKECSFLGISSVIVGKRQYGREKDKNARHVSLEAGKEYLIWKHIMNRYNEHHEPSNYFGDGTASEKIANILAEVEL